MSRKQRGLVKAVHGFVKAVYVDPVRGNKERSKTEPPIRRGGMKRWMRWETVRMR